MSDASVFRPLPALRRYAHQLGPAAVQACRALLWALVALGAGGGVVALLRPAPPGGTGGALARREAPARVTGFAELAVRRWLTTGDIGAAAPELPPFTASRGTSGRPVVMSTHNVAARLAGNRYWAVTVGVEVGQAEPALWFVEIGVVDSPDGLLAAGPPAVVPSPLRGGSALPTGRALEVPAPGDPVVATAQAFLDALLVGRGDVSRYLAPGVRMASVTPAFDSIQVQRTAEVVTTTRRRIVRVEALATATGIEMHLAYELTLEQREGRWEVRRLSGAPTLRQIASPPAATTSTTSPPPSPTTTILAPATPGA